MFYFCKAVTNFTIVMDVTGIIERIKRIQENKQLSNQAFANLIDSSSASLSHLYGGRNKPSLQIIMAVAESFDVSVDYLLYGKQKSTTPSDIPVEQISKSVSKGIEKTDETRSFNDHSKSEPDASLEAHSSKISGQSSQQIESIIIMYNDGTFTIHKPMV